MDSLEDSVEGAAKLHGLRRCGLLGILIHLEIAVVRDCPRAALALWYHTQRANSELRVVEEQAGREKGPMAFLDHVGVFCPKKLGMVLGRFMGAAVKSRLFVARVPFGVRAHMDWHAVVLIGGEEVSRWVCDVFYLA